MPKKNQKEVDSMKHLQILPLEHILSEPELQEHGQLLAREELSLVTTLQEKKGVEDGFRTRIKSHKDKILSLSQAIENGKTVENVECEVVLDRDCGTKTAKRADTGEELELTMTEEDFDLLS